MDVFVIHSGDDAEVVSEKLSELKKAIHSFNPLLLSSGKKAKKQKKTPKAVENSTSGNAKKKKGGFDLGLWKISAKRKIKKAQSVIFFVGRDSHESKNIDWEIKTARKFEKPIYTVRLDKKYKINESLIKIDDFSGEKSSYDVEFAFGDLISHIQKYENGNYKVFNQELESLDKTILLEQYKVFLQTSEDLVSRRQNVNNFYISINSALMAAFGIVWALEIAPIYKFFTGLLLATVGIILSVSWIKLLASYGDLNSSKMKIISYIERQLPASLYDAEWAALSDKLNKRKYVSFTNSEKRVPALFIAVYVCVAICGIAFLI